jgi:4-amino-4-deoxy-L-arabinose transferase-like glycosyltransferase
MGRRAGGTWWLARRGIVLAGLGLLSGFVFFYRLGTPSWNTDELLYKQLGLEYLSGDFTNWYGPYLGVYLIGIVPSLFDVGSTGAVRVVPALGGLATGAVLFLFGRRLAGFWAGVLALALWTLVPHASVMDGEPLAEIKIERFALLDVFLALFYTSALFAGWRWTARGSWRWAAATGSLAGLAMACKLIGCLVLVPIVVLALMTPRVDRERVAQVALVIALCPLVLLASFLPALPDMGSRLETMIDFARAQSASGKPVIIAGDLTAPTPPWWSEAWFMWEGVGPLAIVPLMALASTGAGLVSRRIAIYLGLAVLVPFAFLATLVALALPHYYYVWLPPLTLLAALGLQRLFGGGRALRVVAAVLSVSLAIAAVDTLVRAVRVRPADYRLAAMVVGRAQLDHPQVTVSGYVPVLGAYLPGARLTDREPESADVIVIDSLILRRNGDVNGVQRWVNSHRRLYRSDRADRLQIFIRRSAEAAGLQARVDAKQTSGTLSRAKRPLRAAQAAAPGTAAVLRAPP